MLKDRQKRVALFTFLFLFLWITPYIMHSGFESFQTSDSDKADIGPEEEHTPAYGENWLAGYKYRKRIHMNAISGAGYGYQIKFLVERTTGTDNDYNVHVSTKCQSNYGDVRWTSAAGSSPESYWIQEGYTSSSAWFWVKVSTTLSSATDLYIYYGTEGTTGTTSSISNTFWVGDEFKDSSTSGWTTSVPQGSISEDSDDMHIYSGTNGDWWGGAIHNAPIAYRSWAGGGYCAYWKLNSYSVGASTHSGVMFYSSRDNAYLLGNYYSNNFRLEKIISDVGYLNIANTANYKYYMQLRQYSTTEYYDYYTTDAVPQYTYSNLYSNTEIVASYIGMFAKEYGASSVTALFDYFFVRKWVSAESSSMYGAWYSEETANPVNDQTPTLDEDDGDNVYARYRYYSYGVSVTHKAGYGVMDYVELYCITDGAANYWSVRFDEDTNTFSEQTNPTYIQLDAGSSTYSKSGQNLDVTFKVKMEWAHGEHFDYDLKQYSRDAWASTDTDSYTSFDTDYITTMFAEPALLKLDDGVGTTTRGSYDTVGGITASCYIQYYNSAGAKPPASEVDVWVTNPDTPDTDWELSYNDGTGYCSGAVDSDDAVGSTTYTFKVVQQGAGSGGTNLFYTSYTRTYIADRVEVYSFSPDDTRININTQCNTIVWMRYDYDDVYCATGTWSIESESLTLDSGYFYIRLTKSSVQGITFDGPLVGADTTHGVSKTYWSTGSYTQIWDRVQVQSYTPSDARDDINDDITLDALLWYDYDNTQVTDGTVTLNGISATHQGSGVWRITRNSATVTSETYNTVAVSGNTYGITVVDQNGQSQTIIWDRIQVSTCSASDYRDDINDNVDIDFTLIYDYDDTAMTTGTVWIQGYAASHQGSGVWRIVRSSVSPLSQTYSVVVCDGDDTYGITEVDMNGQSCTVIWDRIQVQSYTPSDARDDINDDITLDVLLWYDYDDTLLTDGTVTINGVSATHQGSGVWRITRNQATPQSETYNTVACSGGTYDITEVDQNSKSQIIIWDRVQVQSYTVIDNWVNMADSVNIDVLLWYDYDNTLMTTGTVTIEGFSASHQGSGVWRITRTSSTVQQVTYDTVGIGGDDTYALTEIDQNSQSAVVTWDRVIVYYFTFDDFRVNIDSNAECRVKAKLEYNGHAFGSGDSISVNGTALSWDAVNSWFDYSFSKSTVGRWAYNVTAVSEATYGITEFVFYDSARSDQGNTYIDLNCATDSQDWSLTGWFKFSADSWTHTAVSWGSYKWDAAGSWGYLFAYRNSGNSDGDLHFYAMYNQTAATSAIFLSPVVYSMDTWYFAGFRGNSTGYSWLDVYDSSGTLLATNTAQASDFVAWRIGNDWDLFTWHYGGSSDDVFSSDGLHYYKRVLSSEEVYGLAFSQEPSSSNLEGWWQFNGDLTDSSGQGHTGEVVGGGNVDDHMGSLVWVVWDRVQVQTTTVTDSRVNINDNPEIRVTLCLDYDNHYLDGSDSVTLDDTAMTWDSVNSWFDLSRTKATVGLWNYYVNSTTHTLFSITALDLNSQSQNVIWDQIEVYWSSYTDDRTNINEEEWCTFRLRLKYDNHLLDDGTNDAASVNGSAMVWSVGGAYWRKAYTYSSVCSINFIVTSASENTYGITAFDSATALTYDVDIIWDQIEVYFGDVSDGRTNINEQEYPYFRLRLKYDLHLLDDGTNDNCYINSSIATWGVGSTAWYRYYTQSTVGSWDFIVTSAFENTYGITALDSTSCSTYLQAIIWDRIQASNLNYGGDSRVNKGTTINFDYTLIYDYDDTALTTGTATINGQTLTHQGAGVWRYTTNGGDVVGDFTADTIVVSGNTYDITAVDMNGKTVTMIWDQIEVYWSSVDDTRTNLNELEPVKFRLRLQYDNHLLDQSGSDAVYINSSAASWSGAGGGYWYKQYQYASTCSINFIVTSASEATYGITAFDSATALTYDQDIIWDQVLLTISRNYGWSFIDNNVTLSVVGTFEYDSVSWSGTWLSNGTSPTSGTHYPYESTYGYYGYKVASITDPTYGLTVFTTNEVQVIWDTVTAQTSIVKYWVQYSVTQVNLIWGVASTWKVQVNNTWLTNAYYLTGYSNGSSPQSSGGIYGAGSFGGMSLGFYTPAWWFVDLTVNCSVTIGARSFDFLIWEEVLAVDILHSIHIEDSLIFLSDDYVTFGIQTNWNNGSFYIWDNVTGTPVYQGGSLEGWYQIPKSTVVGTHVLIVLVNGSQGTVNPASQIATGSSTAAWEYLTFRYTVNPILIELSIYSISESSTKVLVSGICNLAVNYYVWVSDVYQGTGSISASVSFSITVTKSLASAGSFLYGIKFNTTTDSEWFNGTYEVPQSDVFGVTLWDVDFDDAYINIYCQTTWRNSTLYIYDNGVYKAYSPESQIVQYRKDSTEGKHVLAVKISASASLTIWKNLTYSVAVLVEEMKIVVIQWDTGSPDSVSGMIQTNWNNATITLTNPSGTTLASGVEGGTGYGVAFTFRKVQTSGTIHLVTVTITSGSSTMTLSLGYSWVEPSAGGDSTDPRALALIIDNSTRDAVNEALSDKVVVPPAVFGGAVGLIVLLITIVISQAAWHWRKGVKRKKKEELGRIAGFL